jgi:hypothetical protein
LGDELFSQLVALFQEVVALGYASLDHFRLALAVALWGEALGCNPVFYQITYDALGTLLRESLVVLVRTFIVGVCRQLDGNVGVLVQQVYE